MENLTKVVRIVVISVSGWIIGVELAKYLLARQKRASELRSDTGIRQLIGNTPILRIGSLCDATKCEILGKAEFLNGAGQSSKDRVALSIIDEAESSGKLTPGCTIFEGSSGSTAISLTSVAKSRGYNVCVCLNDDTSREKLDLLNHLGAKVVTVKATSVSDPMHYSNYAKYLSEQAGSTGYFADQFNNLANCHAHFTTTGPEIYRQVAGKLDAFVCGAGTGGSIAGISHYLLKYLPNLKICLADPAGSSLYNLITYKTLFNCTQRESYRKRHQIDSIIQGIGLTRITPNLQLILHRITHSFQVPDVQALAMARYLLENEGLFVGSSTAVHCVAAVRLARQLGPNHRILTLMCDSGDRHLSQFWPEAYKLPATTFASIDNILNLTTFLNS